MSGYSPFSLQQPMQQLMQAQPTQPTMPTQMTMPTGFGGPRFNAWPGQGYGGLPGRYQSWGQYAPGQSFGTPGGYFGGSGFGASGMDNPYGPGSYSSPGAMPYGGGSGMQNGNGAGRTWGGGAFRGFGQLPGDVQPKQQVTDYLDYRSPFGAGRAMRRGR